MRQHSQCGGEADRAGRCGGVGGCRRQFGVTGRCATPLRARTFIGAGFVLRLVTWRSAGKGKHEAWYWALVGRLDLAPAACGQTRSSVAHPASVTRDLTHSLDSLAALPDIHLAAAFGRGMDCAGTSGANAIESPDYDDPRLGIPVFSLYGGLRRPTPAMMDQFDVLLVDLQDLGCRIYTFITTLRYMLEAAATHGRAVWMLDRCRNPAGRPVEGLRLRPGWESFVGAGPLPMRHGLTLGELARWFCEELKLDVRTERGQHGAVVARCRSWLLAGRCERSWVNPSPNAPNLSMARCYAGTVMLEGTKLSEGAARRDRSSFSARPTSMPMPFLPRCGIWLRAGWAAAAFVLVRADVSQACRQALPRPATACRRSGPLRPRRIQAMALDGPRVQVSAPARSRLPGLGAISPECEARSAGHHDHNQRQRTNAALG